MAEKGRRWSPYVYAFDNPLNYTDPDGRWPWESKNVKNARSYARANGGSLEKWEGRARIRSGYWGNRTFASVNWTQTGSDGVCEVHAKVFSPEGRSLGGTVADVVQTLDDGGNADPANIGTTTDQDVAVASGTIGVITGGTFLLAGGMSTMGVLLTILGTMNSADDIFTNPNGESGMQQVVSSDETKELIGDVKTGTSLVTGSSNLVNPKTYESPFKIISSLNDIFSGLFNLKNNNDVEENQQ